MESINRKKIIRKSSTILLLLTVVIQVVTVLLMETISESEMVKELHELAGFTFFGLVLVHIVLFRKSIMNMLSSKTS